ncbi:hypothetical protein [Undibacterium sp. Xuan67W]|uniref:hypothetical protein n=1 Tax=Undibacterium sp. Xuan67W TaxID=3413057 RepID=UPI003BF104F2
MNKKTISPAVSFYDGCVIARDRIWLCGKLDFLEYDDYSHSRSYSFGNNTWGGEDLPYMTTSVCVYRPKDPIPAERAMCTLAEMAGCVHFYWAKGVKRGIEMLPGAEEDGGLLHLQQIIQIGDDLYVVGSSSQVYRRHQNVWQIFNQGLEETPTEVFVKQGKSLSEAVSLSQKTSSMLHSIDGSDFNNLFAVGFGGIICHRGDGSWKQLEQVTNANLHRVKYVDENTVYAVGDKGILLKGNAKGFHAIKTGINDDLWGLEWFNNKLYIGTKQKGLYEFDGKNCHKVMSTPKKDFECHTLNAYDGQLLALGSKDIFLTDDCVKWRVFDHPDNQ